MSELSPKVEKYIAENISFRMLVYLYICQYPTATKASLAARLGIAPITVSRAIAEGKRGVDQTLVPEVMEIIRELDFSKLLKEINLIRQVLWEQERYEREKQLQKILSDELSDQGVLEHGDVVPFGMDWMLQKKDGSKRYFVEQSGNPKNVRLYIHNTLGGISRTPGNDEVTLVCYSQEALQQLMSRQVTKAITECKPTHPITVMSIDLEQEKILAEYILYTPGKEPYSMYELEDSLDYMETDDL